MFLCNNKLEGEGAAAQTEQIRFFFFSEGNLQKLKRQILAKNDGKVEGNGDNLRH